MFNLFVRIFCVVTILVVAVGCAGGRPPDMTESASSSPVKIRWTEMTFVDDKSSKLSGVPVRSTLWADGTLKQSIERRVKDELKKVNANQINFDVDGQLESQQNDSYFLTLTIAGENVESQQVDDTLIIAYELQALVLVGNMSKDSHLRRIVASYPVRVRFRDKVSSERTPAQNEATFKALFRAPTNRMPDIIAEWVKQAARMKLHENSGWLRVEPLEFSEPARTVLQALTRSRESNPNNLGPNTNTPEAIGVRATSLLEAGISNHLNIPIVPPSIEQVMAMMCQYLDDKSKACQFEPIRPDYRLVVKVVQLKEAQFTEESGQKGHGYGATMLVQMFEAKQDESNVSSGQKLLFETVLKREDIVVFVGERTLSSLSQFSRVIANFHAELASNLCATDGDWLAQSRSAQEKRKSDEIKKDVNVFCGRFH